MTTLTEFRNNIATAPVTSTVTNAWQGGFDYEDQIFHFSPAIEVAVDGKTLDPTRTYLAKYTAPQTSHATNIANDYANLIILGDADIAPLDHYRRFTTAFTTLTVADDITDTNQIHLFYAEVDGTLGFDDAPLNVNGVAQDWEYKAGEKALAVYNGTMVQLFPFSESEAPDNIEGLVSFYAWTGDEAIAAGGGSTINFGAVDLSLATYAFFTIRIVLAATSQYKYTKLVSFTDSPDLPPLLTHYNNSHVDVQVDNPATDLSIGDINFRVGGPYAVSLIGARFLTFIETGLPQLPFHTITLDPSGSVTTFLNGQTSVSLHDMKLAQVAVTLDPNNRLALATPNPAPGVTVENYELGLLNLVTASDRVIRLEQEAI